MSKYKEMSSEDCLVKAYRQLKKVQFGKYMLADNNRMLEISIAPCGEQVLMVITKLETKKIVAQ